MAELLKIVESYVKDWMRDVLEELKAIDDSKNQIKIKQPSCDTWNKYVKIDGACEITGFSKGTIYNLISKKQIPFHRIRRSIRFDPAELELWIKEGRPEIVKLGLRELKGE